MKNQDIKNICQRYLNGEYLNDIAKSYGYKTTYTIKQILMQNGIKIRTQSENIALRNTRNSKYKNINFFKTQSADMAWLLGFLAADGCIYAKNNSIKIGLSTKDREILEKIKETLKIENKICDYISNNGFEVSELRWTCSEHKKDLAEYGIIPNKTFVLGIPNKLERKYWIDYIRGYFDGDGSINLIHSGNLIRWQVCSATKEIIEWIVNVLYTEYQIPKVNIQSSKRKNSMLYYIQYSTKSSIKIFNILYTDGLKLDRKYQIFKRLVNERQSPRDCTS